MKGPSPWRDESPGWYISTFRRIEALCRAVPVVLGTLTLASVGALLFWDAFPGVFPARAHDILGALPLALIASAYLIFQLLRQPPRAELIKAGLLAVAFLFWGANQFRPDLPAATLFNDIAIGLFVLDLFLVIRGWPPSLRGGNRAETDADPR